MRFSLKKSFDRQDTWTGETVTLARREKVYYFMFFHVIDLGASGRGKKEITIFSNLSTFLRPRNRR